jgi:hypothetical protein
MLRPFILALDDDATGKMRDPDGGTGFVDMLSAGAAGPVGVDPEVFLIHVDLDIRIHFRQDGNRGEGRVPPSRGVEGGNTDHAVDAVF